MLLFEKIKQFFKNKVKILNQLDISWQNRPYDFYLIFGQNEESRYPWIRSNWDKDFEPFIDLLLKKSVNRNKTGIRATTYKVEKRFTKNDNKEFNYLSEIKSGRLKWDAKSHDKWTLSNSNDTYFQDFELWTPGWTICEKKDSPPDIFISIFNEADHENKRKIQFGYFIVIAVAQNLKIDSQPIITELSRRINSKISVVQTRKWGKPKKGDAWTFNNWIQDTSSNGIYKGKSMHSVNFNEIEFEPFWNIIYKA